MTISQEFFVCYFFFLQNLVISEGLHTCTNDTVTDCCLCPQSDCDKECPSPLNYFVASSNKYSCNFSDSGSDAETSTAALSSTTWTDLSITTDLNVTDLKTTEAAHTMSRTDSPKQSTQVIVCLAQCPDGYFSSRQTCNQCDSACKTCNAPGLAGCTKCKFTYKDTCYEVCPKNTTENDSVCRDQEIKIKDDKDGDENLAIVIGAGVGGGIVVVIIVVILICCCRRKRRNSGITERQGKKAVRKTVMSGILAEKSSSDTKTKRGGMGPSVSRQDYMNTAPKDATLSSNIQRQGDVVLRYTKDPTESVKINTMKQETSEPASRDSTYENAAMIKVMRNFSGDDTLSQETLQERLDIEALPVAPTVPVGVPDMERRVKQKKAIKVPMSKRISQKFSKKKKKTERDEEPIDEPGENYIDMSHTTPVTERKGSAENQSEENKNTQTTKVKKPTKSEKSLTGTKDELDDYENAPEKLKAQSKTSEETTEDHELEDYENMSKEAGLEDYENVEMPVQKGKTKELLKMFETGKSTDKDKELEDYENTKALSKKGGNKKTNADTVVKKKVKKVQKKVTDNEPAAEDDLEDYENTKDLSKLESNDQSADTVVKRKVKKVQKKVTDNDPTAEDDLEDYENTKDLSKLESNNQIVADNEAPYENIPFDKGKMKQRR